MATINTAITATDDLVDISASLGSALAGDPVSAFRVKVDSEVMLVRRTQNAGKQIHVIRGVNGTTAAVHASGATITADTSAVNSGVKVKAGAVGDADYDAAPPNGTIAYDSTAGKLMIRIGGAWKTAPAAFV